MQVDLLPEAEAELQAAAVWYDERRAGLGDEFVQEVSAALIRIGQGPGAYPQWPGTENSELVVRKAPVRRFPYLIAFEIRADLARVLAVAHAKRRPLYWIGRLGGGPV